MNSFRLLRRVEVGSFTEFKFSIHDLKINLSDIQMEKRKYSELEEPVAVVRVSRAMNAGKRVRELESEFAFAMPAKVLEQDDTLFAFGVDGQFYWFFFRVAAIHINPHARWVDFEISGFWARE